MRHLSKAFVACITGWFTAECKPYPWRTDPTPYHIWLSEIMLQQTRIEAAIPYYLRFIAELPDIAALAACPDERLMKLWEGLGYYSRVRNLKKTAVLLCTQYGGCLPSAYEELVRLPGIGEYTAGAIASVAFGRPVPAVDGNVLRVVTRVCGLYDDINDSKTRQKVRAALKTIYPSGKDAAKFSEGLMELGEQVCLPKGKPHCEFCPVKDLCAVQKTGKFLEIPYKSPKNERKALELTVFLLRYGDSYALRRRPDKGLLAGMWELPNCEGTLTQEEVGNRFGGHPVFLGTATHIFTHVEWHMTGYLVDIPVEDKSFTFVSRKQLHEDYAMPSAFRAFSAKIS